MLNTKIHDDISYTDNFKKIITFYLFECPVENVSARGYEFGDLGWTNYYLRKFNSMMKDVATIEDKNWRLCNIKDIDDNLKSIDKSKEYIVCNNGNGKTKSIFYAIRNAFAHGSFEINYNNKVIFYHLKNIDNSTLKADIYLKEETLILWISLFNTNPEYLTTEKHANNVTGKVKKGK